MKWFALLGLVLFLGVAVAPSINADTKKHELVNNVVQEDFINLKLNKVFNGYIEYYDNIDPPLADDNCECEKESQPLRWGFPIFCTLLFPYFFFFAMMGYAGWYMALLILGFANLIGCYWAIPPNSPPDISPVDPLDGKTNIPLDLEELRFQISDNDKDRMSYTVTTDPDIGTGNGNLKLDGVYSVPISGLVGSTQYTWFVEASDGEDTTIRQYRFTTVPDAPVITQPFPGNESVNVPIDTTELIFHLTDYQGDLMDYSVETSPDIGSASGNDVTNGIYYVPVQNMDYSTIYHWYVNATDGLHQTKELFMFQAEHKLIFDPFVEGWQYRKKISINHTNIVGNLTNFPILIDIFDTDLRDKAQNDGDDILFMDGTGVAHRLFHEIEYYSGGAGKLIAWVNISSLSSQHDTSLYMYYGNPSSYNQQASPLVWDTHYRAVWHMNDETLTTIKDSAGDNIGTKTGESGNMPDEIIGKIGNAQEFNEEHLERIIFSSCPYPVNEYDDLTVSIWSKTASFSPEFDQRIISTQEGSVGTYYTMNQYGNYGVNAKKIVWQLRSAGSTPMDYAVFGNEVSIGEWVYSVGTVDRYYNLAKLFMNGDEVGIPCNISTMGTLNNGIDFFAIGADDPDFGWRHAVDGTLDEIRISDIVRSPEWIATEYNNQIAPSSFYILGPEETGP